MIKDKKKGKTFSILRNQLRGSLEKKFNLKKIILILVVILMGCATPKNCCAQVDWCDSISYSVLPNTNGVFSVMIETTDSLDNYCDTVDVAWAVCTMELCFLGNGAWASFPIVQLTDTVKVCYNAYIMNPPNLTISCYDVCEWIVYNGTEWVELSNTVGITEIPLRITDNNIYDINGKVVTELKNNTMYIRKNKKFIRL